MAFKIKNKTKNPKIINQKTIKQDCKNCSSFVLPKDTVDLQGFKVDYGFCSHQESDYYQKSILMIQKSCNLFTV